jgi:hypothetical protein
MTPLIIVSALIAAVAFAVGWFRGYQKACNSHGWHLPKAGWNQDMNQPLH